MAKLHFICLLLLGLTTAFSIANSTRLLDELDSQPQAIPAVTASPVAAAIATPVVPDDNDEASEETPAAASGPVAPDANDDVPEEAPAGGAQVAVGNAATTLPVAGATPSATDAGDEEEEAGTAAAPVEGGAETPEENPDHPQPEPVIPAIPEATPAAGAPAAATSTATTTATVSTTVGKEPSLSFFMHDIIGGTHPSARVVAGIVANTDVTGLPFSKFNNNIFPITGGIPLVNPKLNGIITNNNLPLLVGLNAAQSSTVFQNRGTSNVVSGGDNQPFVSAGNLPDGLTLQKLMFGSVTVIDDQLTESHELDSTVIGRAQGFYLASSLDGSSQTVVITVILHDGEKGHEVEDTISFFGVHRSVSPGSEIAVVGGTGKYENAKGYAVVESLPQVDQHTTDGVDTILHFIVYLTEEFDV